MEKDTLRPIITFLLAAVLVYAMFIRLFPLKLCDAYWDEAVYLLNARAMRGEFVGYQELSFRPPLLPFLFSLGLNITHDLWLPHLIVVLLATGSVYVMYKLVEKLFDYKIALISAVLIATNVLFIRISRDLLTDAPSLLFISLCVYWWVTKRWEYSGIALGLASLMRYPSFIFLFVFFVEAFVEKRWDNLLKFLYGFMIFVVLQSAYDVANHQLPLLSLSTAFAAGGSDKTDVFYYLKNLSDFFTPLFLFLIVLGFIATPSKNMFFVRMFAIIFLFYLVFPHKEMRYLLPLIIPGSVIAASFFRTQGKWIPVIFGAYLLLTLSYESISIFHRSSLDELLLYNCSLSAARISPSLIARNAQYLPIYTASEYPTLAYYTNMTITRIPSWMGDSIFTNVMNRQGYYISQKTNPNYPTYDTVKNNTRFTELECLEDLCIFEYNPQ